ncbi:MAG: hypothetical protein WCH01_15860, partial [Methylococcaceae bacterium]
MPSIKYYAVSLCAVFLIWNSACAIDLPSNEELFASGRKSMGETSKVMLESEKLITQGKAAQPININPNSPAFKP